MKFALSVITCGFCLVLAASARSAGGDGLRAQLRGENLREDRTAEILAFWPASLERSSEASQVWVFGDRLGPDATLLAGDLSLPTSGIRGKHSTLLTARVPPSALASQTTLLLKLRLSSGVEIEVGEITVVDASRRIQVEELEPDAVPRGATQVEFQIRGRGLRDATTVLVAGIAAQPVSEAADSRAAFRAFFPQGMTDDVDELPVQLFDVTGALTRAGSLRIATPPSVAPTLTLLSPSTIGAGEPGFTLTINGSGFDPKVRVTFDNRSVSLDSVTTTVVKAIIPRDFFRTKGDKEVVATNPSNEKSNTLKFTVTDPIYAITSVQTPEVFMGGPEVTLNVFGNNIPATTLQVKINDQALPDGITVASTTADRVDLHLTTSAISTAGPITFQLIKPPDNPMTGTPTVLTATLNVIDRGTVVSTLAGEGFSGFADGPLATARFTNPVACATDSTGKIWIVDHFNHAIRIVDINAGTVKTIAGNGKAGFMDGTVTPAILAGDPKNNPIRFNFPDGIVLDSQNTVYVSEIGNNVIRRIRPQPNGSYIVDTFAGTTKTEGATVKGVSGFADGPARQAKFNAPEGMALAADGTMYMADSGNNRIRKITGVATSPVVSTLAGGKKGGRVDKQGTQARFDLPMSIVVYPDQSALLVGEIRNRTIRKITLPDAKVSTFVKGSGSAGVADGGPVASTSATVTGMHFRGNFVIFADDINANIIRQLDMDGSVITMAGKLAIFGGEFADGLAFDARFNNPRDICFLPNGRIVVVDESNHRLRLIDFRR